MTGSERSDFGNLSRISAKVRFLYYFNGVPTGTNMRVVEKRAAAQQAEANFFALLRASGLVTADSAWKDVRSPISISKSFL